MTLGGSETSAALVHYMSYVRRSRMLQVRTKLQLTVSRLIEAIPRMRIALIAHGDYCDWRSAYVTKVLDFTNDVTALVNFAETVSKTGGGDSPEVNNTISVDHLLPAYDKIGLQ